MRVTSLRLGDRTRPLTALIVLVAWFGSLLVSTATSSQAQLPVTDNPTITGPSAGKSTNPTFTISVPSGGTPQCAWKPGTATPDAGEWASCTSPTTYVPSLPPTDGNYRIWVRTQRTVTVPTTTPVATTTDVATTAPQDPADPSSTPTATITPVPTTYPSPTTYDAQDQSAGVFADYTLLQAGPTVTRTAGPADGTTGGATPTWTYSAEGFPVTCTIDGPGSYTETGSCTTAGAFPSGPLPSQGAYTVTARAYDGMDLAGSATPLTYTVDTVAPVITITGAAGTGTAAGVEWVVTMDDAGETTCSLSPTTAGAPTTCAGFATYTLPAEGTYTLTANGTDDGGNPATAVTRTYTYDRAPAKATITGDGIGNVATGAWTVTTEAFAGTTASCTVTGPNGFTADGQCAPGTTSVSVPLTGGDGSYAVTVTVTDAVGSSSETATYVLDRDPPEIAVVPLQDNSTTSAAGWTVTVTDGGGTPACTLTYAGGPVGSGTDCGQFGSLTLPAEGTYTFTATTKDAADNTATATDTWIYRSNPTVDVTTDAPTGFSTTVDWHVTSAAGTEVDCTLTDPDGASEIVGCIPGSTPRTVLTGRDGTYTFDVVATDLDTGFTSTASATYDLDRVDPTVSVSPAANASTTATAGWTVTTGAGGLTPTCVLTSSTGQTLGTGTGCPQFAPGYTLPYKATFTLTATTLDAAGNDATATATWIYRDAPTVTVTTAKPTGNSRVVTWTVSATPGTDVECTLTDPDGSRAVACTNASSPQTTVSSTEGTSTFTAVATDPQTRFTDTDSATYVYDITPLPAFSVTGSEGDRSTRSVSWAWTATGTTSSCQLQKDGTASGTAVTGCTSPWTTALPADGTWSLAVTLYDAAGNGRTAISPVVRADTAVPDRPTVSTPKPLSNNRSPAWTITGEAATVFTCSWSGPAGEPLPSTGTCANGYAPALTGADGVYTLSVTQTDAALNTSLAGTATYTLDRTAPVVTFTQQPTGPTNNPTVVWTTTVSELNGTTVTTECRLVRRTAGPDDVVYDWTPCNGRSVTEVLIDGDGSYVLQVRDTDAAGNVATDGTSSVPFQLDTTGPGAPPKVTGPAGWGSVAAVTWTITAPTGETPAGYLCRLVRNNDTTPAWTACDDRTYSTTLPSEATYRLDVVALDSLQNRSAPVTSSVDYFFDPNAPAAAVFTGADSTGKTTSHTWTWSAAETFLTAECRLYQLDGTTRSLIRETLGCTSPRSETLASATAGTTYVLEVTLVDRALNSTPKDGPTYLLDTVAPLAPAVSGPGGTDNERGASYTFVPAESGTTAVCQLMQRATGATGWTVVQTQSPCTSAWSVTLPSVDGEYTARVVTTDRAGNASPYGESGVYTLDVTGPVAATFTGGPTGTDNLPDVTWTWTYEDRATATCAVDRVPVGSTTSARVVAPEPCTGTYTTKLSAGDGTYTLTVTLTDQYGTLGASATSVGYTLDLTAPGAPSVSGPSVTSNTTTADYALAGPVEAGATAECQLLLDNAVSSAWAACSLPRTVSLGADGTYVLQVRLTDEYGNTGPAGSSPAYLLDTKLPTVPVVTAPASPASSPSPTFTFTIDADTTASCSLARGTTVVGTSVCAGSFTGALTGLADGDYVLTVVSKDAAGNTSTGASGPYTYDTTAPVAPSVTGPTGPSQNRNPVFSWTGEAGASAECSLQEAEGTPGAFTDCATPYAPTLPADGTWVLTVRLTDSARNVSAAGSSGGYELDTTPPPTPSVTAPSSPGRDLAPSWSAALEDGSKAECRFTGPSVSQAFAPCTFPLSTPVSGDGTYQLDVRTTDAAGNVSAVGTGTYVLDTTAPAAPVVTQPTGPSRNRNPSIAFTAETGTAGSCRLTRGTTVLSDSAVCSSPASVDLTGLPDGAYTLSVRAVDAAGNTGPAGTATYVLDTTAPAAPTMTLVAGSPSSDRAPVYAFNVESGSTTTCRLTTAGGAVRDLACASPLTLDLSGSIEGEYVLAVTARDAAGNTSAAATSTYVLDGSAPAAPRVAGPVSPGSTRTPTWRVSSTAPAECRFLRGTTVLRDWAPCGTSYTADLFGQPDAIYLLEARVVGTTAQTSSRYRLDTAGPAAATLTPPPSPSTVRTPTWAVASPEPTVTAECRVSVFGGVMQDWTTCGVSTAGSLFTIDLTGLGDGTYTLSVRLTDSAGNTGPVATSDYVLDTSAPAAVGVSGPPSPGNDTTPTWTLNSTTGAKLECRVTSGQKLITDFAPCAGTFTADLTGLPDGPYTLTVHALSAAGTPGPDTTSTYLLDTTASDAPGTLTGPTGPSRDRSPTWTFVLPAGSTAVCKVTSGGKVYSEGACRSPFTLDLSNAPDGSYTLTVRAVDAAGNLGSASTAGYILRTVPAPPPVFTQLPGSPSSTTNPRWGFTTVRGVLADCRILYGGVVQDDWSPCTSPYTMVLSGKPDGKYTLQVRSHDSAGNTSAPVASDYTFDRSASPLALFVETPATPGTDLTPTWVVGAPDAVAPTPAPALVRAAALTGTPSTQCRLTTPRGAGQWEPCTGRYTATTTGDGTYLLEVRAADSTGATGPSSSAAYVLDTDAPGAPRFTETPPAVGNDAEISWSWTDDPELLVECRFLRGASATAWAACTSPYAASLGRLGQNTYTLEARAVDMAGNVSGVSASSYRYDTTPPPQPVFVSRPPARGSSSSATWTFAVPVDTSAVCVVTRDGTVVSEGSCNGSFTIERMNALATWSLSVRYVDAAGNVGPAAVGSYTLTTAVLVRDRVDGPTAPGGGSGGPFAPRPPAGNPTGGNAPPAPTGPAFGPEPGQPRAGGVLPRISEPVKRAVRNVVKNLPLPPVPGIPEGTRVPEAIKNAIGSTITKPQLPLALFFIVLLFLLVQNRIDRRDPKLAAAPVTAEPELEFGPRVMRTGGATA